MRLGLFSLFLAVFFSACTQKVMVKAIVPAQVGDKDIKSVSLEKFKKDNILLRHNINSKMSEVKFDGKNYFHVVNREDLNKVLAEQKLQDSGLVNNKGDSEYGLSDISSIISGEVNSKTHNQRRYTEQRTDYNTCLQYKTDKDGNEYCVAYRKYKISCISHKYSLSANIKITRVSNSDIIFQKAL